MRVQVPGMLGQWGRTEAPEVQRCTRPSSLQHVRVSVRFCPRFPREVGRFPAIWSEVVPCSGCVSPGSRPAHLHSTSSSTRRSAAEPGAAAVYPVVAVATPSLPTWRPALSTACVSAPALRSSWSWRTRPPLSRSPMDAPTAVEMLIAVRGGDIDLIRRLLAENPDLARTRFGASGRGTRTALHFVTDWPGYFPNGPDIVKLLIDAGADPNALTTGRDSDTPGPGSETPLHWAASSDDVDVAVAPIDGGADLETPDGSIGTPLDNAVGYACWHVARLLVARGARVEKVWHASALGMLDRLDVLLAPGIDQEQISQGFWHACGAGQRRAAERLLGAGAALDWVPDYAQGTALDAATGLGTRQDNVIEWLRSIDAPSTQISE